MATGSFQLCMADCTDMSQPSVCNFLKKISHIIASLAGEHIKFPELGEENNLAAQFSDIAGMPGVIGCIDGTHIPIIGPGGNTAELYRCRKGYYSINVQGVCDASLRFRNIVASWPGSIHDSRNVNNSAVCHVLEQGNYEGYLLADSAYPCCSYLLTPVLNPTNDKERRYNTAQIKTRNVVERAFGVLKRRFACIGQPVRTKLETTKKIIMACAVLHNIFIYYRVPLPEDEPDIEQEMEGPLLDQLDVPVNVMGGFAVRRHVIDTFF